MSLKEELITRWKESGIATDERIIEAFREIKREDFVSKEYKDMAYTDIPLPIGFDQTISQPTTIIMMIASLEPKESDKILEVGTGSGYNAALLSKLSKKVYTIESIKELCDFAKRNLEKSKIKNVEIINGDGSLGYEKNSPYDKIMITAACPDIPRPLIDQVKMGGTIIAPVGSLYSQQMVKLTKTEKGIKVKEGGSFRFVPLVGEFGFKE